jgi:hypothetical protein
MPATKWNQNINAGQDWMSQLNLLTADGSANRDITGQTLASEVRRHFKSASAKTTINIVINDASQGLITMSLNNTQTSLLKSGKYVYDVELTTTATGAKERVIEGVFTVKPEATQ